MVSNAPRLAAGLAAGALAALFLAACGGGSAGNRAAPTTSARLRPLPPAASIAVQRVFASLPNFTQPIAMLQEPGNSARWYVVQKTGSVRVFDNTPNVSTTREFINLSSRLNSDPNSSNDERGLLGMAFHPELPHRSARLPLLHGHRSDARPRRSRLANSAAPTAATTLDPATELVLFNVDDPEDNHNGGNIAFGPDGFLYIGIGDGGGGGDGHGTHRQRPAADHLVRQDAAHRRVGVDARRTTYAIPPTNPYAANARCNVNGTGAANCPEIYAYGFRNPWRWSFDRGSGELWLNDVGQSTLEEVDLRHARRQLRLALLRRHQLRSTPPAVRIATAPIAPVAQYGRSQGFSTTGGFVYRGSAIPALHGRYVFGDFGSGNLWHIARDTRAHADPGRGTRYRSADRLVRPGHRRRGLHRPSRRHAASPGAPAEMRDSLITSAGALLFELQDRLPAGHGDFAFDARAIGDGEDLGDDLP